MKKNYLHDDAIRELTMCLINNADTWMCRTDSVSDVTEYMGVNGTTTFQETVDLSQKFFAKQLVGQVDAILEEFLYDDDV